MSLPIQHNHAARSVLVGVVAAAAAAEIAATYLGQARDGRPRIGQSVSEAVLLTRRRDGRHASDHGSALSPRTPRASRRSQAHRLAGVDCWGSFSPSNLLFWLTYAGSVIAARSMDVCDLHKLSDRIARASGGLSYLGLAGGLSPPSCGVRLRADDGGRGSMAILDPSPGSHIRILRPNYPSLG
jgi:hypothetical protein